MENVNTGYVPTADSIVEDTITELEIAQTSFEYIWERWFSSLNKPDGWDNNYPIVSAALSAHKILVDRILDDLMSAYGMGREYRLKEMKVLLEASAEVLK